MSDSNTSISSGLDAIFNVTSEPKKVGGGPEEIAISDLQPSPYQPRTVFEEESLKELARSIVENGIIQPIIVRKIDEHYEIIAGERRWRAAKIARLTVVPVIVKNVSTEAVLAFSLIENIQRKNLSVMEEAKAYKRLIDDLKLSHDEIANRVGKSRPHITNILRLLSLTNVIQTYLEKELISMGHARALLSLEPKKREQVAQIIIEKKLSVRETERLIQKTMNLQNVSLNRFDRPLSQTYREWELALESVIPCNIKIDTLNSGKTKLTFTVNSEKELEYIINKALKCFKDKI